MLLSAQAYAQIDRELEKFPVEHKKSAIMAALAIAQDEIGWVSPEAIADVANYLKLPAIAVQEVATFYNMFDTRPVGRFKITVCTNLPCALRDGVKTAEYLKEKLGIGFRETTPDGQFTLVEGECMGACGDAPVLLLNNKHMCVRMLPAQIDAMLGEMQKEATQQEAARQESAQPQPRGESA